MIVVTVSLASIAFVIAAAVDNGSIQWKKISTRLGRRSRWHWCWTRNIYAVIVQDTPISPRGVTAKASRDNMIIEWSSFPFLEAPEAWFTVSVLIAVSLASPARARRRALNNCMVKVKKTTSQDSTFYFILDILSGCMRRHITELSTLVNEDTERYFISSETINGCNKLTTSSTTLFSSLVCGQENVKRASVAAVRNPSACEKKSRLHFILSLLLQKFMR